MEAGNILRPGVLFLAALALLVGFSMYDWSKDIFPESPGNGSLDCSQVEVSFLDRSSNGTHTSVFVRVNRGRPYAVIFDEENSSFTRLVDDPRAGEIHEATAPVREPDGLRMKLDGCSRVFRP